jgi:hypothetical protein
MNGMSGTAFEDDPFLRAAVEFLAARDDYVLFGGFAGYLQTNVRCSNDLDVLVRTREALSLFHHHFRRTGWRTKGERADVITLEAGLMTLDLCHYERLVGPLMGTRVERTFLGFPLLVLSPEALFVTKLNHLTLDLEEERTGRDREVIRAVRPEMDARKLRALLEAMGDPFWIEGRL